MKLLYISTPSFADCDFPLIREYQRKKIDVTYLILLPPFSLKSTLLDIRKQIPKTGIFLATEYSEFKKYESYMDMNKVYVANRTGRNSLSISYWKHKLDLYLFIKRGGFDIIHCDYMLGHGMSFLFKLTKKWIQTIHDPFPHSGEISSRKTKIYNNTISNSDYFVLLNERQKKEFCTYYGVNEERVFINRLGIYDNIKAFVKPEHKVKSNNILFFGRISPYKGIEYLCEAIIKVREVVPDVTLTIAGGGKMYFDIDPYKQLGYTDIRNHYVGMGELAELLSECELSVCPYTDATQRGVIMTSYALGKPVIATDVGGLPEMIEQDRTGIIIPPRDSSALAIAIIKILKDKNKLQEMSAYINNEYGNGEKSWNSIAKKYIQIYNSIL